MRIIDRFSSELAAPLLEHAEKEEDVVFPGAAQLIDDAGLERLDRELRRLVLAR